MVIHEIIKRYGESIWPVTSPRQTELNIGNLEPDLLAGEVGWVASRRSCRTKVKWMEQSLPVFPIIYTHLLNINLYAGMILHSNETWIVIRVK